TGVKVQFALRGTEGVAAAIADGIALYTGALGGADVVHRPHPQGTEDYVVFESAPQHEELAYDVDVSGVPRLRFVSNTLPRMSEAGPPVLRVAPPYLVDAKGARHEAKLSVEGCAFDTSPAAPWGRAVTSPGASRCTVRIGWAGVAYPAMVDPAWTTTGSMATA